MQEEETKKINAKEAAYLYDLYIVPQWRERFDRIIDQEIKLPEEGTLLDAGCGTGGFAIDMALRAGAKTKVVGIDSSEERLALARGKAEVVKLDRALFSRGTVASLGVETAQFDLVVGDASLTEPKEIGTVCAELARVAKPGATIAMKLTTRGSFDEFFSIYWESLYNLELTQYTPQLEGLITERLTVADAETAARAAKWKNVRSVTEKERFDFPDGKAYFESPLMGAGFLDHWMAILPDQKTRDQVQQEMISIIDRERQSADFDVSIKATVLIGQR
jgi:ubiquinone/menaquinone biosynthesis C-methylase UbiE